MSSGWPAKSTETNVVTNEEVDNLGKYAVGGPVIKFKQTFTLDWDLANWGVGARYFRQNGYQDTTNHSNGNGHSNGFNRSGRVADLH